MTDQIVTEWMAEWKRQVEEGLDRDVENLSQFGDSILANEDLFQAITHVLEECDRFRALYNDVISTLFAFCRSAEKKLRLFSVGFVPSLVYIYLYQIHAQKKCIALETLLRGMFELEGTAGPDDKAPFCARIPNIHLPSIYHDPGGVSTSWISDGELERLTARTVSVVNRSTLVFTEERVRAPQRLPLCTELWWIFNYRLPDIPKHAIPTFLKTISRLTTQGFNLTASQRSTHPPVRIILSSKLLIEMIHTIYFSVYNGAPTLAEQVLEEALNRANYQLWPDAMLVCNAVRDYLKSSELPLQVEANTFKKSIITNASFRTKKLPEDIPIVEADTIHEEGDAPSILSKSKVKLPHLLAKMTKRNSVVVINEEGDVETTMATPPERKKSMDSTPV
jgi:hypothetical protein